MSEERKRRSTSNCGRHLRRRASVTLMKSRYVEHLAKANDISALAVKK